MVVDNTKYIILHGLVSCLLLASTYGCKPNPQLDVNELKRFTNVDRELKNFIDQTLSADNFQIVQGISIERLVNLNNSADGEEKCAESGRSVVSSIDDYLWNKVENFARTHVVTVSVPETARFFKCKSFVKL